MGNLSMARTAIPFWFFILKNVNYGNSEQSVLWECTNISQWTRPPELWAEIHPCVLGMKCMCNILSPVLMFCLFVPLQQGKGSDN